jgi:serine protease Do
VKILFPADTATAINAGVSSTTINFMRLSFLLACFLFLALVCLQAGTGGSHLGVKLADLDSDRAKSLKLSEVTGALVLAVEENSAADQAGLRSGDVILSYNGEKVLGAQQLGRLVLETPQDRKVTLKIWREGKAKDIVVTTAAPSDVYMGNSAFAPSDFITDIPAPLMVWKNVVLGFDYEPLSVQLAQFFGVKQGSLIRSVQPSSPAEKAGIRAGDIITGVAGHSTYSPRDFGTAIRMEQHESKPLTLELSRDRKSITILVKLVPEN